MPTIYDISFNQKAVELIPPDKRYPKFVKWMQSLLKQLQNLSLSIFTDFKTGALYDFWVSSSYSLGDRVIYGQSVYESLTDGNTGTPTDASTWQLYQLYFKGVDERIMYTGQTLVFEYALNSRFLTNFRQPPLQSDIYISVNAPVASVFQIGYGERYSSSVLYNTSTEYIVDDYSFVTFKNMVIHVPVAVYDALSTDVAAREKIIRNFAQKYSVAGILFEIQTY